MWRYIAILVVVLALWNTVIIKPLKLLAVFLHELGHASMAFVFGHGIEVFNVSLDESGYVIANPKSWLSNFMVTNAGYLGSVLFALLILYLKRTGFKKYTLGTLAIIFFILAVKFSNNSWSTLIISILFAAVVIVIYMLQNDKVFDWSVDIIGISCVAYAIYDIFVDTILFQINGMFHIVKGYGSTQHVTDAVLLQRLTHIPAVVWGVIWLAIALLAVNAVLIKSNGSSKRAR